MDEIKDIHFPKAGIDREGPFLIQGAKQAYQGQYARTTYYGKNVRAFDAQGRWRGGSRPGLQRYIDARVAGADRMIQLLDTVTGVTYVEGSMQTSQSGRVVTLVAISQGAVYKANAGDTAWSSTTNATASTPPLNPTGVIFSTVNRQKMWFADGTNWSMYNPADNTVGIWNALAGTLPAGPSGATPRLIETWRGRIMLSGIIDDPQNVFATAVDNPRDFDYGGGEFQEATDAIAFGGSRLGYIGDIVTGMVPFTDNFLGVGGDHTLSAVNGDPMAGGEIIEVSNTIGMAWGRAWCLDSSGVCYFMSNQMRVYAWAPGSRPQRISFGIDPLIEGMNPGENSIRLFWDERLQGFHVFITELAASANDQKHFFFEQRSGAWWEDRFAQKDHNPIAGCVFDGNEPGDRRVLIGGWDGYVRAVDEAAATDDGETIDSEVWIGPFVTPTLDDVILMDVQAILDEASGDVTYEVYTGNSAQDALESELFDSGVWEAGRNITNLVRAAGYASYLRLTSTSQWAMETIRLRLDGPKGKVRSRGR